AALDQILTQYYLTTDTPTIDYVYSLAALGAQDPEELQPILEANSMEELIQRFEKLMTIK
ncbi:MAG: LON domain containing protein, partial [Candidatus Nitrosomaritimum yanchengensis]